MYRAVCADCRKDCEVPFKPTGERPVYCKDCFAKRKVSNQGAKTNVGMPSYQQNAMKVLPKAVNRPVLSAHASSKTKSSKPTKKSRR
jgi:CxxC-x17-CxxC domain-containing protein